MPIRQRTLIYGATATAIVLAAVAATATPAGAVPTIRERQWHLDYLHVAQAHAISSGKGVTVGVVDSGVDAGHPDLGGQVLPGTTFVPGETGDGRRDTDGHGTGMAVLIAGRGGGPNTALGIAPGARILPVVTENGKLNGKHLPFANSIRWAVDHGATVLNVSETISLATAASPELKSAVRYAMSKDVVVVIGAGNTTSGAEWVTPPANIPGVVAVGGVMRTGEHWDGSAHGKEIVLTAPAEEIASGSPKAITPSGYALSSGTSDATAIVSGVAALIRSKYPELNAANVVNRLIRTAQDKGAQGRDELYGFGIVDPVAALGPNVPTVDAYPLDTTDPGEVGGKERGDDRTAAQQVRRWLPFVGGAVCLGGLLLIGVFVAVLVRHRRRRR